MATSYSKFTPEDIDALGIDIEQFYLFEPQTPILPSARLSETLKENLEYPLGTEKAKSELLITPILSELRRNNPDFFALFSGYNFNVDKSRGLTGRCDYLLTRAIRTPIIKSPIMCVVEAKNDEVDSQNAIAQCIAEMYAAQLFNTKQNNDLPTVFGATSTGFEWLFMQLNGKKVKIDYTRYYLNDLPQLLSILQQILDEYK